MKRLGHLFALFLLFITLALPALPVHADSTNLLQNPSVETANGATPDKWEANQWGANTATLTYNASGHTGSKSIRIDMSGRTDGDAKWMPAAVTVTPDTSYTYTDFYKASADSEIDLQYTDAAGNVTYTYAQWMPAASDWTPITVSLTTPANAVKAVPMHILAADGWLQMDDFSLSETILPPAPSAGNLIANESFATANGTMPSGWLTNSWGTNASNFVYETTGHADSRSVTVNISSFTDGDAKWYAQPVAVTPGKSYTYTDYYKSTVATRAVAAFIDANGEYTYAELESASPSADWAQHTAVMTVPESTIQATVFHLIDSVGSLTIDDVSLSEAVTPAPVDDENLVPNNSVETANGALPAGWAHNTWGTNTATFTYGTTGRTGSRSVTVSLSAFTDGDAKWYFQPATVVAGKPYLFRDYYKANVATRVVAALIDANGNYTYMELPSAAAASDWAKYETTFAIPAGITQATVFHLIDSIGSLTIDDMLLQVSVPTGPDTSVPNGSLETGSTAPEGWTSSNWGSNTAVFDYANEGHTGTRSAKVTVSNYVDGDAKWYFNPISTLTPGSQYRVTAWYKGTAAPHVVAMYILADGTEQYVGLPSPLAVSATAWTKYTDTFTVPEDAVGVSVFMYVAENGWVQTDDYSITTYHPNGFNRPLVTLTFDDGHEDNHLNALPLLNSYGFKSTQCYATSFIEGQPADIKAGVMDFFNTGHEICSHTVTHPFLTQIGATDLDYELKHAQDYLESLIGQPVIDFASPYGDYNATVNDAIDNYYQSHRTVDEGFNSKDNFDIYRLRVQNILDTTTAAQIQSWVEQAQADNTWLILVYHRIADDPGPYDAYTDIFAEHLQVIADSGIIVKTMQDAITEVKTQL